MGKRAKHTECAVTPSVYDTILKFELMCLLFKSVLTSAIIHSLDFLSLDAKGRSDLHGKAWNHSENTRLEIACKAENINRRRASYPQ